MSAVSDETPTNPLASLLKTVGRLTHPDTRSGRLFQRVEGAMTRASTRLAGNERFLNLVGRNMERSFKGQAFWNRALEATYHAWRTPTLSDLNDVRQDLRRLYDQVEATGSQVECLVERMEKLAALQTELEQLNARLSPLAGATTAAPEAAAPARKSTRRATSSPAPENTQP